MTVEAVGFTWDQATHWLTLHHCGADWRVSVGSLFCRLRVTCPTCGEVGALEPDQIVAIMQKYSPPLSCEAADALDADAETQAMTWYEGLPGLEGLGESAEYTLFPLFLAP